MGKKAVEMGRYGASELMRNKNLQKKAVNYGISKLAPFIQDSVGTAMDELSTKVRPKKNIKLIDQNWTEGLGKELMFTNGLENYQNQKLDGPQVRINIWDPTILSNNN